ncbi:MAG: AraC family transcriptional regulator [Planctomycetia bacterium]|nr:AraC family transcriptional regulator [Planctomycetia bacterium]
MPHPPSIYREQDQTYRADTCESVKAAMKSGSIELWAFRRGTYPGTPLARGALPGVASLGYWDVPHDQDWGLPWHRNEGIELTFLETGRLGFAVAGQEFMLRPDDLTITRPWQPHRVGNPTVSPSRLHFLILDVGVRQPHQRWNWPGWLVLTKTDRQRLTDVLRHNEQAVWHAGGEIRRAFERIGRAVRTDRSGSNISRLAAYLNELFVLLLDMFHDQRVVLNESLSSTVRTVELFLNELRDNRANLAQPWSVPEMARQCGLGTTHFIHHCKQVTNVTPAQYLNQCRIETAAKLLVDEPALSVTDVALACGYSSSQYFAAVFRAHLGATPRAYREDAVTREEGGR